MIKKPVLLVVSFGTSFADAREKSISAVEDTLAEAFPAYEVRRAFTSGMILKKLRERDGIRIDSVPEAMERLIRDGVQEVVVQPTHVMNGIEYEKMVREVRAYEGPFARLTIGRALLSGERDLDEMIRTVFAADAAAMAAPGTALVYMGHGTGHEANRIYAALQEKLRAAGHGNIFIGTVESAPTVEDVLGEVRRGCFDRVVLLPLMIVAGDHAVHDMAGDGVDSWKNIFLRAGFDTACVLRGLGECLPARRMIADHCAEIMKA